MAKETVSALILTLLLTSMLTLAFNVQPAKSDYASSETIYIQADGSIQPSDAPISSLDNVTYTLTDNITGNVPQLSSAIIIQRDNIIIDGAGYTLQCTEASGSDYGVELPGRSNVTIKNMKITAFWVGIFLYSSSNNSVSGNDTAANDFAGVRLHSSSNNSVSGNTIANNGRGILLDSSINSAIYHNNFINNTSQVSSYASTNVWDDGYPSGGNHWSDYAGVDEKSGLNQNQLGSDGIGDTPYVVDVDNRDNYPLMKPYPWNPHDIGVTSTKASKTLVGQGYGLSIDATMFNYGDSTETFNITAYANTTEIWALCALVEITLTSRNSTTLTFTWNTTDFSYGNYIISVVADNVPGEADVSDNTRIAGTVHVGIPGDVTGDYYVGIDDIFEIASRFGEDLGSLGWDGKYDITNDAYVGVDDIFIAASHFGEQENP